MIIVGDKSFVPFIERKAIEERVAALAFQISRDYQAECPLLVGVLNGAFMFAADLMKEISIPCEISFVKVSSYQRVASTGRINQLIGLQENITGRHVVIVEDIVDTGLTMSEILKDLHKQDPRSVEIATLLFKPEALRKAIQPRYVGFEIDNRFVVGYGLDYNGLGRNLADLYVLKEEPGVA